MFRSPEFRLYTLFTAGAVAVVTLSLIAHGVGAGTSLRIAAFNVVSLLSCCGFATADFQAWPALAISVLLLCMLVGGCSGSAAGGLKQIRLLVVWKLIAFTVRQFARPHSVERSRSST